MIEYWPYVVVFLGMFFTDIIYTYYLGAVQDKRAFAASNWAVVVYLTTTLLVISYTIDHWLLIPAILGAWLGTYIGIKLKK